MGQKPRRGAPPHPRLEADGGYDGIRFQARATMHPLIAQKLSEIACVCRDHQVRRLEVFGSAARGIDFDPEHSDADVLVEFEPGSQPGLDTFFGLKDALAALLRRKVDLLQPRAVRNPYVLASIDRARELVYGA